MRFLLKRDYNSQIREHVRNVISAHNDYTLEDAEDAAIEEASGYLRHKYDMALTFVQIASFSPTDQYNEGDYVADPSDKIYKALVPDPGTDLQDTTKWIPIDPRNKKLVAVVVDLALYLLFTNTGRQLSELRVKRYDDAINWLERVQKELIQPQLPLIDENNPSGQFLLGSNPKLRNKW